MIQLPGSSMLPDAANVLDRLQRKTPHTQRSSSSPTLGHSEQQRLRDVSKRLSKKRTSSKYDKVSPYIVTNSRLKNARQQQIKQKLRCNKPLMQSKSLEQYFLINRNEQEVSINDEEVSYNP